MRIFVLISLLASANAFAASGWDAALSPARGKAELRDVIERVKKSDRPLVVFDIDDTVIDERKWSAHAAQVAGGSRGEKFRAQLFSDPMMGDMARAQTGVVSFIDRVRASGGHVVFVSGRWESERAETMKILARAGVKIDASDVILNGDSRRGSLAYKKDVARRLRTLGKPVAFFDNEPASVREYHRQYPAAAAFRLRTAAFHDEGRAPAKDVRVISDFKN